MHHTYNTNGCSDYGEDRTISKTSGSLGAPSGPSGDAALDAMKKSPKLMSAKELQKTLAARLNAPFLVEKEIGEKESPLERIWNASTPEQQRELRIWCTSLQALGGRTEEMIAIEAKLPVSNIHRITKNMKDIIEVRRDILELILEKRQEEYEAMKKKDYPKADDGAFVTGSALRTLEKYEDEVNRVPGDGSRRSRFYSRNNPTLPHFGFIHKEALPDIKVLYDSIDTSAPEKIQQATRARIANLEKTIKVIESMDPVYAAQYEALEDKQDRGPSGKLARLLGLGVSGLLLGISLPNFVRKIMRGDKLESQDLLTVAYAAATGLFGGVMTIGESDADKIVGMRYRLSTNKGYQNALAAMGPHAEQAIEEMHDAMQNSSERKAVRTALKTGDVQTYIDSLGDGSAIKAGFASAGMTPKEQISFLRTLYNVKAQKKLVYAGALADLKLPKTL